MQFTNTFTVPAGRQDTHDMLVDLERIAPCFPGAALDEVDGDEYTGRVKVKLGPMSLTYRGTASVVESDVDTGTITIRATGNEARGGGTAAATVAAVLAEDGDGTAVTVTTDLDITGRPAQFGRGVMGDVGTRIIDTFADCLSRQFDASEEASEQGEVPREQAQDNAQSDTVGAGHTVPEERPVGATVQSVPGVDLLAVAGDDIPWPWVLAGAAVGFVLGRCLPRR